MRAVAGEAGQRLTRFWLKPELTQCSNASGSIRDMRTNTPADSALRQRRAVVAGLVGVATLSSAALRSALAADGGFDPARYAGKIVYLDFWASWCPPCLQSFPWMQALADRHATRPFAVVGVNLDRERAAADRFIAKAKPRFDIAYDPAGASARRYEVKVMPSSFLLDAQGRVIHRHEGFKMADQAGLEARIATLLEKS